MICPVCRGEMQWDGNNFVCVVCGEEVKPKHHKVLDLTNKCGSCIYFHPIEGTARGECHQWKYKEDVAHNPEHPYFEPVRSRMKCGKYRNKPVTYADMIRSMTDAELAKELSPIGCHKEATPTSCIKHKRVCESCWLEWLKKDKAEVTP